MDSYLSDDLSDTDFLPEGEAFDPNATDTEPYNAVGIHFFATLGIPITAGRQFGAQDTAISPRVGIINQSLARARFPGQNPLGKRFSVGGHNSDGHGGQFTKDLVQIIGVCGDTLYTNLREQPPPQFFIPYVQQSQVGGMTYEIRTRVKAETIVPSLRRAVHAIDPNLPLVNVRTQDQQIDEDLRQERLFVTLSSGFGILALILASVGVYGVVSYSVARRTKEIGIRLALGAIPRQVLAMVLSETSRLSGIGIAGGVIASFFLSRMARSMLFGIGPNDPATIIAAAVILLAVGFAASWVPARRAALIQPVEALRHE
jgi:predicted permease